MNNGFHERKQQISTTTPTRYTTLRQAAESLSRHNADLAVVELFSEAMQRLTLLAYEQDESGFCNIDAVTHRFLIPLPFGRAGHKRWGLRPSESVVLRQMMQTRQAQTPNRPPGLWLYDRARRAWRLNLFDYDRLPDGLAYWRKWPLTVAEYRQARSTRLGR